ncbi:MAG: hypothetical protein ACLQNV_24415, partial [Steroidobacteraceae bacterium]
TTGSDRRSVGPSWQSSATESLQTMESLFAENHEPFFNSIDPLQSSTASIFDNAQPTSRRQDW